MKEQEYKSRSYYLTPVKIVRDLVHEYINLTKFDIELIDTVHFQRLKDVRRLTCQHVYPAARHTRFDHSLGVLELTRKALKHLNQNGIIVSRSSSLGETDGEPLIDDCLQFNAALAALLHDVGHCPFSHMGEEEFDAGEVRRHLYDLIKMHLGESGSASYQDLCERFEKKAAKGIGSVHEQLSCIVIFKKY
ncbi:MAG: HD domain-containing protein [Bacillota bacterium]